MMSGRKSRGSGEWSAAFQKKSKKKKASDKLLDYQSDGQSEYDEDEVGNGGNDSDSEMNLSKSSLDSDDVEDEDTNNGDGDNKDDGSSCDGSSTEITVGTRFTQTFTVGNDSIWTGTILSLPAEEGGKYTVKYDGKKRQYTISESKLRECKILGSSGKGKGRSTKPTTFDEEEEDEIARAKPAEKGKKRIRLSWEEKKQQIEEFEANFGHINVPGNSKDYSNIGRSMSSWRECYRYKYNLDPNGKKSKKKKKKPRGTLTDEQEKWLDDKDFDWFPGVGQANKVAREKNDAINHQKWLVQYQQLVLCQRKHGNCQVLNTENAKLTKWVARQRANYRKLNGKKYTDRGRITQVQVDLLNKIGFVWDPTGCTAKHEEEAKKFTRDIVIDTGNTQLTDEEMKAMACGDTSGIVQEDVPHLAAWPREDTLVEDGYEGICPELQRLSTERLLARPCIGDDDGLAPELLALWGRNMCKITGTAGTRLPFHMLPREKRVPKPGEAEDYIPIQIEDSDDDESVSEEEVENEEDEPFPELTVDLHLVAKESSRATKARRRKARRGPQSYQPKLGLANIPKIPTDYTYDWAETVNGFGIRWPSVQSALARRRNRRGRRKKYPFSWCFDVDLDQFEDDNDGKWICIEASECPTDPNWYNPRWTGDDAYEDEAAGSGGSDDEEEEDGNSFGGRTTHDIDFGDDETSANTTSYRPRVTESPQAGTSSNEDDKHSESEEEDDVVPLESQDARDITETTQTVDQTRQLYKIIKEGELKQSSVDKINEVRDEFYTHVKRWMASRVISMDDNELKVVKGLVDGLEEAINDWEEFICDEVDTMFYTDACRRIFEQARSTLS